MFVNTFTSTVSNLLQPTKIKQITKFSTGEMLQVILLSKRRSFVINRFVNERTTNHFRRQAQHAPVERINNHLLGNYLHSLYKSFLSVGYDLDRRDGDQRNEKGRVWCKVTCHCHCVVYCTVCVFCVRLRRDKRRPMLLHQDCWVKAALSVTNNLHHVVLPPYQPPLGYTAPAPPRRVIIQYQQ